MFYYHLVDCYNLVNRAMFTLLDESCFFHIFINMLCKITFTIIHISDELPEGLFFFFFLSEGLSFDGEFKPLVRRIF